MRKRPTWIIIFQLIAAKLELRENGPEAMANVATVMTRSLGTDYEALRQERGRLAQPKAAAFEKAVPLSDTITPQQWAELKLPSREQMALEIMARPIDSAEDKTIDVQAQEKGRSLALARPIQRGR